MAQNNSTQTDRPLFIYADIETNSFRGDKLLQIAAVTEKDDTFNIYINPMEPLLLSTINLLGLHYYKGDLYKKGLKLQSFTLKEALNKFTNWIEERQMPVIIVFHNGFNFDCSILIRYWIESKIKIPTNLIKFGDTLPFFRNAIKPPLISNHTLASLAAHFKIQQDTAHCALADTIILKKICEAFATIEKKDIADMFTTELKSIREVDQFINKEIFKTPIPKFEKVKTKKPAE